MKRDKVGDRDGRQAKDLKRKKLSVTQQAAVRGGILDGTSNTLLVASRLPAVQLRPTSKEPSP